MAHGNLMIMWHSITAYVHHITLAYLRSKLTTLHIVFLLLCIEGSKTKELFIIQSVKCRQSTVDFTPLVRIALVVSAMLTNF